MIFCLFDRMLFRDKITRLMENKVIDTSVYEIGKDSDGVMRNTKELHEILLKMILEFDRICRKNDIPYALGFGSALGVYNYQGFIPWDDDMDIVVPLEYFPKLCEACKNDLSEEYSFECYENNKKYNVLIPTGKFRLKSSYLKELSALTLPNKGGTGATLFLDVCAFMGVPEDPKEHIKLIKYTKRRMPWYVFVDGILRLNPYKLKARLKKFELNVAEKYKDSPMVSQTVIIPWQDWSSLVNKLAFPREVIYPFKEYDFEGHKLFSFNNVEEFCRLRYGEKSLRKWDGEKWVDPFPQAKRKVDHIRHYNLYHCKNHK